MSTCLAGCRPAARRVMRAVGAPVDPGTAQQPGERPASQQHGQAEPLTPELQEQAELLAQALHAQALRQAGCTGATGEALQPDLQRRAEQLALKLLAAQLVAPSRGAPAQGQAQREQAQKQAQDPDKVELVGALACKDAQCTTHRQCALPSPCPQLKACSAGTLRVTFSYCPVHGHLLMLDRVVKGKI